MRRNAELIAMRTGPFYKFLVKYCALYPGTLFVLFLTSAAILITVWSPLSEWLPTPAVKKQQFAVIPAIHKEFKIKVISAIKNDFKIRPDGHISESATLLSKIEKAAFTTEEICMLKDNEWWAIENNTTCLKVSDDANRAKNGEAVSVRLTRLELNKTLGECFRSHVNLYCFPRPRVNSQVVFQ
tara:strand:- start:580 stop:1131 length:552 start_codon:yes stop_codon:yes gene_type:complete